MAEICKYPNEKITVDLIEELNELYPFSENRRKRKRDMQYITTEVKFFNEKTRSLFDMAGSCDVFAVYIFIRKQMAQEQEGFYLIIDKESKEGLLDDICYQLRMDRSRANECIRCLMEKKFLILLEKDGIKYLTSSDQIQNFEIINAKRAASRNTSKAYNDRRKGQQCETDIEDIFEDA